MIFTKYETAAEFSDDTLKPLKKHEIQNNLLLKNIGDGPNKTMLTVKNDSGNILLTAIRTSPFPMLIFETENKHNDDSVAFFAESLVKNNITVDFFMTEPLLAKSFTGFYEKQKGVLFECTEKLVLYIIEKVNNLPVISGKFRAATGNDLFYIPYWYADFIKECDLGSSEINASIESSRKNITYGNLFVWEDGFPVSMATAGREVTDCRFIVQVYTPPHLRGKGYSTACVSSLTKKLLDDGYKYCALYADCANPYSNAIYRKIGYKEFFRYDQYKIKE